MCFFSRSFRTKRLHHYVHGFSSWSGVRVCRGRCCPHTAGCNVLPLPPQKEIQKTSVILSPCMNVIDLMLLNSTNIIFTQIKIQWHTVQFEVICLRLTTLIYTNQFVNKEVLMIFTKYSKQMPTLAVENTTDTQSSEIISHGIQYIYVSTLHTLSFH